MQRSDLLYREFRGRIKLRCALLHPRHQRCDSTSHTVVEHCRDIHRIYLMQRSLQ
jgi:hypothetical protein